MMETATQLLYARLRGSGWRLHPEDEPLARCFCALLIKLDPMVHPALIATVLHGGGDVPFDETAFVNAMAALGFRYLRVTCRPSQLDDRLLPALLKYRSGARLCYIEDGAPVVLDGRSSRHVPPDAADRRTETLVFSRLVESDRPSSKAARASTGRTWFATVLRRFLPQLRYLLLLAVFLNILALSVPLFILLIYDRVLGIGETGPLIHLAKGAVLIVAADYLLRRVKSRVATWIMARLDYIVGCASFEKLLALPASLLDRAEISEQVARIKTFEAVRDFLCGPLMATALELPMAALSLLLMGLLGGKLVVIPLVALALYAVLILQGRARIAILIRRAATESSKMQQFALDTFAKLDSIRLDGLTEKWLDRYREASGREQMAQLRLSLTASRAEIRGHLVAGLAVLALLYFGAHAIWAGSLNASALIACVVLQMRALAPFHALTGMLPRLEQLRNAIAQIDLLMDYDEEDAEARTLTTTRLDGSLQLSDVALRYEARAPLIFSGLNLDIRAGEVIAVTGPNGSGKTSLMRLVLGLVQPQIGGIRLSGFDIRQLSPHDLRGQIAYMPQTVTFFSGTIAENMRFGMPVARDSEIEEALREAGAWDEVEELPEGLWTVIDPPALQASNPLLHERLALARALLRPSNILLIDERPSSVLLAGLAEDLKRCIVRHRGAKTIVIVSLRTDFLRLADRVLALTGDSRTRIGTLDQLMAEQS
ncbi:peptidase domain-containing ABC transporter [Mangrovicoccus sp. HB161399]|uniref:peptidase domain-containing ABC transporter n=1 Tax=Mangrovicoccus sp. HB161399 TaxID=2720392 RepID=UPI001557C4E3|nr:ATP-binding cassette domain-containing protein [Mangrovicoccus sp. HB161399]